MVRAMVRHKALMCEGEMQNQAIGSSGDWLNKDIGSSKIGPSGEPLNITVRSPDDPMTRYFYFPTTSTSKVSGSTGGRGRGSCAVGAGFGPNFAVTRYTLCVFLSSAMVRARGSVGTFCTTLNLSGESS